MTITIDNESGFCFGVTSAIEKAEEELKKGSLCCLGDIVHNGQEVERLEQAGLRTIGYADLEQMQGGRVLLRAHGEPPSTYQTAQKNNINIIDATCPVVKKLQERIKKVHDTECTMHDAQIVIFGKVGHAEVIGLQGQTNNTAIVIENLDDLNKIDFHRDIYLFSQTTKSVDEFKKIVESLKLKVERSGLDIKLNVEDSICRNVANRAQKMKAFAAQQDLVIFVGGQKSSNAKVLFKHCLDANPNSIFISSPDELSTPELLSTLNSKLSTLKIGICGATSTPLWLMEQCKDRLKTLNSEASKQ